MGDPPNAPPGNYVGWRAQTGWRPPEIVRAEGSRFWDSTGREYLDLASQLVATNLGHGNPAVRAAIRAQLEATAYVHPGFSTPARRRLGERLARVLPAGLGHSFFSPSGTEANEAALRIARAITRRPGVIALARSYHGATAGSLSVSGDLRREAAGPDGAVPGTTFVANCYCYRCPLGLRYPSCGVACADEVDKVLVARSGEVAAMIVEPVVGTNGVIVPVPEYLPKVRAITRAHDVLLIADEVMTGWGRTGAWFAVDRLGGEPDLLTTAKGITGGYVPLGLTATTDAIHDRFADRMLPVGHTYEAHPVALAAADAAIAEYERLDLPARSRSLGELLLTRLRAIAGRHPSVGDVRGLGLFAGIELVRDRATKEPLDRPEDKLAGRRLVIDEILASLASDGVYALGWVSTLIIAPPLIIEREELDRGLEAVDRALEIADRHLEGVSTSADGTGQI